MKHWRLFLIAIFLGLGACTALNPKGCSVADASTEQLNTFKRSVLHLAFPDQDFAGTATALGGNTLITCRHCLPDYVLSEDFRREKTVTIGGKVFKDLPTFPAKLNGEDVTLRLVWAGATEAPEDDVAIVEVVGTSLGHTNLNLRVGRKVNEGEVIYLIGFWHASSEQKVYEIEGRVTTPPFPWLSVPGEIICVEAPREEVYTGISGGVAVVWDHEAQEFVAVGIYRGKREWDDLFKSGVHAVRRFTPDLKLD